MNSSRKLLSLRFDNDLQIVFGVVGNDCRDAPPPLQGEVGAFPDNDFAQPLSRQRQQFSDNNDNDNDLAHTHTHGTCLSPPGVIEK